MKDDKRKSVSIKEFQEASQELSNDAKNNDEPTL